MNLVDFIVSINKISLVAFIATLGFVGYEVYLLKKEKTSQSQPVIPNFDENAVLKNTSSINQLITSSQAQKIIKTNPLILIFLVVLLFVFGAMSIIGFISVKKNSLIPASSVVPTPQLIYKKANGVKIFNQNFELLTDKQIIQLKPQTKIIIGIDKISGTDVDKARIRVNKNLWDLADITEKFDSSKNIFYIEYTLATNESKLRVEAQLHSQIDGWLGN